MAAWTARTSHSGRGGHARGEAQQGPGGFQTPCIAPRHAAETDSVAGHIGFELRCAERIFISLRKSKGSDLRKPMRTVARPRRIIFSAGLDCLLFARAFVERCTQRARSFSTSEFKSSQAAVSHIATLPQVSRSARCSRMLRLDRAW